MQLYQHARGAKSTNTGAASQLRAGLPGFQLQLLRSCDQHVAFLRGEKKKFLGFMVKNQRVKTGTEKH